MQHITLTKQTLDALDRASFALAQNIESDDVLVSDGNEVVKMFREDGGGDAESTLSEALDWFLADVSGNAFEMLVVSEGLMCKLTLKD
jgi:hypothetical protein